MIRHVSVHSILQKLDERPGVVTSVPASGAQGPNTRKQERSLHNALEGSTAKQVKESMKNQK